MGSIAILTFCVLVLRSELAVSIPYPEDLARLLRAYQPNEPVHRRQVPFSNLARSRSVNVVPNPTLQEYLSEPYIERANYEDAYLRSQPTSIAEQMQQLGIQSRPANAYAGQPLVTNVNDPYVSIPSVPTNLQPLVQVSNQPLVQKSSPVSFVLPEITRISEIRNSVQPINVPLSNQQVPVIPQGYNVQHFVSNPRIKEVLETTPIKKRFLVIYSNGTVEHLDTLDTVVNQYPNYLLLNERNINPADNNEAPDKIPKDATFPQESPVKVPAKPFKAAAMPVAVVSTKPIVPPPPRKVTTTSKPNSYTEHNPDAEPTTKSPKKEPKPTIPFPPRRVTTTTTTTSTPNPNPSTEHNLDTDLTTKSPKKEPKPRRLTTTTTTTSTPNPNQSTEHNPDAELTTKSPTKKPKQNKTKSISSSTPPNNTKSSTTTPTPKNTTKTPKKNRLTTTSPKTTTRYEIPDSTTPTTEDSDTTSTTEDPNITTTTTEDPDITTTTTEDPDITTTTEDPDITTSTTEDPDITTTTTEDPDITTTTTEDPDSTTPSTEDPENTTTTENPEDSEYPDSTTPVSPILTTTASSKKKPKRNKTKTVSSTTPSDNDSDSTTPITETTSIAESPDEDSTEPDTTEEEDPTTPTPVTKKPKKKDLSKPKSVNPKLNPSEPIVWFRSKDPNFLDKLTSGDEKFDVVYFFQVPPSIVERDTKTTIFPNGTVLEELTEKSWDGDEDPTVIKTSRVTPAKNKN